jgi:hypothetical protein
MKILWRSLLLVILIYRWATTFFFKDIILVGKSLNFSEIMFLNFFCLFFILKYTNIKNKFKKIKNYYFNIF